LLFDFNGFWRENVVKRLTATLNISSCGKTKKIILKERDVIETKMKCGKLFGKAKLP